MWLAQYGHDSMLSRKKGRRYGESHQKALQISVRMLPLVDVRRREGAVFLPGFSTKRHAWSLCMKAFAALWLEERCAFHTMAVQGGM
jgi:hypothetical protein